MNFLIILIVTAIVQIFTPWWSIALVPFVVAAWRPETSLKSFAVGFIATAIIWFSYGLYLHIVSEGAMSNRIAELFSIPNGILLLVATTIVGGLVGGSAALAGSLSRLAFVDKVL